MREAKRGIGVSEEDATTASTRRRNVVEQDAKKSTSRECLGMGVVQYESGAEPHGLCARHALGPARQANDFDAVVVLVHRHECGQHGPLPCGGAMSGRDAALVR